MEEYLKENGWELHEIIDEDLIILRQYKKDIKNYHVTITTFMIESLVSNTKGRDYSIHIDNADYQTIFSADIQTVEHINKALEYVDL